MENYNDGYYHIGKDIEDYPDAVVYVVWSPRGPGKTYSVLWHPYENNFPTLFMKRTIDDVKLLCTSDDDNADFSPWKPINRDKGTNIHPKQISKGIGGFYESDAEGNPTGKPFGYIAALSAIKSIKGFDLSECEWLIVDEFIPQAGEIVRHKEGDMLLDLYMTLSRDRERRGRPPLKLILLGNAEEISTPITNSLEIVDDMARLAATGQTHLYIEERGILLHHITEEEFPVLADQKNKKTGLRKVMAGTAWASKAFEGEFSNNDFSNVCKIPLKGMQPLIKLRFKTHDYYIYMRDDGMYYMCKSPASVLFEYDLNKENDQKRFFSEYGIDLRNSCIEDMMKFQSYSMYDLIVNYKKYFDI